MLYICYPYDLEHVENMCTVPTLEYLEGLPPSPCALYPHWSTWRGYHLVHVHCTHIGVLGGVTT